MERVLAKAEDTHAVVEGTDRGKRRVAEVTHNDRTKMKPQKNATLPKRLFVNQISP
jgi:hypothetical protein